jgi:hypothetical protein
MRHPSCLIPSSNPPLAFGLRVRRVPNRIFQPSTTGRSAPNNLTLYPDSLPLLRAGLAVTGDVPSCGARVPGWNRWGGGETSTGREDVAEM